MPDVSLSPDDRLFFLHIHKTAGTSATRIIASFFQPEEVCPFRFDYQLAAAPSQDISKFRLFAGHFSLQTVMRTVGNVRIITVLRDPRERIISAYFYWRHRAQVLPPDRPRTEVHKLALAMPLAEFISSEEPSIRRAITDVQARLLAGGAYGTGFVDRNQVFGPDLTDEALLLRAKSVLNDCLCVGFTERLPEFAERLALALGMSPTLPDVPRVNVTEGKPPTTLLDTAVDKQLDSLTRLDRAVIAHARSQWENG